MTIDMTAQLVPVFWTVVALLMISAASIVGSGPRR
jgi:hypothetical protein